MAEFSPGTLTDVPGVQVGHAHDHEALTGCTVVLVRDGAVAGVSVRGLAPGTREIALLRPGTLVSRVQAILLTGGSAFGLSAADGAMRFLEEQALGFRVGDVTVPIVPAAVLYDLGIGDPRIRPDARMGYLACQVASTEAVPQGNVGTGMGATVGKLLGVARATKSGLGSASIRVGDLVVGALVAVNAFGDVLDPSSDRMLAGTRGKFGDGFVDATRALRASPSALSPQLGNTVIGVVATNARLDPAEAGFLASAAHDGLARVIRPAHTLYDGDALFALSAGQVEAPRVLVDQLGAEAVAQAIINGVLAAEPAGGLPSARSTVVPGRAGDHLFPGRPI